MRSLKSLITFLLISLSTTILPAQKAGYNIKIGLENYPDSVLYLASYYGNSNQLVDTAFLDKGMFTFTDKKPLGGGIYIVITKERNYFELLIDKEQNFSLTTKHLDFINSMKIKNSVEGLDFYDYLKFMNSRGETKAKLGEEYKTADDARKKEIEAEEKKINQEVEDFKNVYTAKNPSTLLTLIINASKEPEPPTELPLKDDGTPDSTYIYKYYKKHFFDGFAFSDDRLLRSPVYAPKIKKYYTQVLLQVPDTLIKEADSIIAASKPNKETYKYCIWYFTYQSETSEIMGIDAVFVHLVNKYYKTGEAYWVNEKVLANITKRANTLEPLLIGKTAPNMIMIDTNNNLFSMNNISSKYTIVLFWDPDCGHCKAEIPLVRDWVDGDGKVYGVKVFSVCADTNLTTWKKFLVANKIQPWHNVNGTRSATKNYHDLYDIISTPTIYLLDENKKIMAKRISHKQVEEIIKRDFESKKDK